MPIRYLIDIATTVGDCPGIALEDIAGMSDDELPEVDCCIWVSGGGQILKIAPNFLETNERPFSVFCYDRDETCFMASPGVPRLMRNASRTLNASWARLNDNSDLAVGPQYIFDPSIVRPVKDDRGQESWAMEPNKGWQIIRPGADPRKAFWFFDVPSNVQYDMMILDTAKKFVEEETMLPEIAQGQQTAEMTKTAHGLELLMNSANTVLRRVIKDWDDKVTIPLINRMIDWNMQSVDNADLTGQFIANAKGTSSLLLKETQAKNAMALAKIAGSNKMFAERTKWDKLYRQIIRGLQLDPSDITMSDEEIQQREMMRRQQPPPMPPELQVKMRELQVKEREIALKEKDLAMRAQLKRDELVMRYKVEAERLRAKLNETVLRHEKDKEKRAFEAKIKEHERVQEARIEQAAGVKVN